MKRIAVAHRVALCLVGLLLLLGSMARAAADTELPNGVQLGTMRLSIYSQEDGSLMHAGLRTVRAEDGRVIMKDVFHPPDGGDVALEQVAEFDAETLAPISFELSNYVAGDRITIERREGGRIFVSDREEPDDEPQTDTFQLRDDLLWPAVVEPYVLRRWERLVGGRNVSFPFLVPGRVAIYDFRLRHIGSVDGDGGTRLEGFVLEPDSWVLRQIVEPLEFYFEAEAPHRLMEYRGQGSIPEGGPNVRIAYEYDVQN